MVEAVRRHIGTGLVALLLSSAAFGTSGPFAKALIEAGWTPGAVVLVRMAGAAAVLLPVALWGARRDLRALVHDLPLVGAYGLLAVAAAQLGYFQAVERLTVGVALLIEYLGIVLISSFITVLFLGGWNGPWLPPVVWFALKTAGGICFFILMRASLPRPRYDQLMAYGWKVMLPLGLANLVITGAVILT